MRLTLEQRTDLALRALRRLRVHATRVQARTLAPEIDTSAQYLPHVLRPLVGAGWVESTPGPRGGYQLVVDLGEVSLLALIELMEGPTTPAPCVLRGGPCGSADLCALHEPWQDARDALLRTLAATPVAEPVPAPVAVPRAGTRGERT